MIPPVAKQFQRTRRNETAEVAESVQRQWRRMGANFDSSWAMVGGNITAIVKLAQRDAAEQSRDYFVNVLEETGQTVHLNDGRPNIDAFVGLNGDGRNLETALYGAVIEAKKNIAAGGTVATALQSGQKWVTRASGFALADTCRAVNRVQFPSMKVGGYVRVLTAPSCARCAVLAGKRYESDVAFERHPNCDCQHLPASDEVSEDMLFNAEEYFDSLSPEMQDKIFTKAGAEAIRNGADINQVVNARRGMYTTADGATATREGVTRRGLFGSAQRRHAKTSGGRYGRATSARLMPEQIQKIAGDDQERYLNLLKHYGYLI